MIPSIPKPQGGEMRTIETADPRTLQREIRATRSTRYYVRRGHDPVHVKSFSKKERSRANQKKGKIRKEKRGKKKDKG
jgi:hypothetical protein